MKKKPAKKPARKAAAYHHGDLRKALHDTAASILEEEGLAALSLRAVARNARVPCRPGAAPLRQLVGIGVQHGVVVLIRHRAKNFAFVCAGVGEQVQCLVAVASEYRVVEALAFRGAWHRHAICVARHACDGTVDALANAPFLAQCTYIGLRAATRHATLR